MISIRLKFVISYILIGIVVFFLSIKFNLPVYLTILLIVLLSCVATYFLSIPIINSLNQFHDIVDKISAGYLKLHIDTRSIDMVKDVSESLDRALNGFASLIDISRLIIKETNLDKLLNLIIEQTTNLMEAERATLFLYNKEAGELWSYIASELEIKEIRLPIGKGIAGYVAKSGKILNIRDAYNDPRFDKDSDKKTGFKTRNIIAVPMFNHKGEILGVIQSLNKKGDNYFHEYDESLLTALAAQASVVIENAKLYESQENLLNGFMRTIAAVVDARDPVTRGHSGRVAQYSVALAKAVNFSEEDLKLIEYAAILHDVGKISIPDSILQKPGQFTKEEYEIVKLHAIFTREILSNIYSLSDLKDMPRIASSHHEKLDGSGYPMHLKANEISAHSRILAIVDMYDAMVSYDRPYKPAMSHKQAAEILKKEAAAGKIDSKLVDSFLDNKLYEIKRREHARISPEFSIEYSQLTPEEWKDLIPIISDISRINNQGIFFDSRISLPVESYLSIKLNIHNSIFDAIARVVKVRSDKDKFQIGISFINLTPDTSNKITEFLTNF